MNENSPKSWKQTKDDIPDPLQEQAYELWGEQCALCGSKRDTRILDLHHCWYDGYNPFDDEKNPYINTKPWQLVPLCRPCHGKIEWQTPTKNGGSLLLRTLRWLVKKKGDQIEKTLEEYLDEQVDRFTTTLGVRNVERVPLGDEKKFVEEHIKGHRDMTLNEALQDKRRKEEKNE